MNRFEGFTHEEKKRLREALDEHFSSLSRRLDSVRIAPLIRDRELTVELLQELKSSR